MAKREAAKEKIRRKKVFLNNFLLFLSEIRKTAILAQISDKC